MRWIVWLLLIFAAAIATALLSSSMTNEAQVTFTMYKNIYEISFNAFVIYIVLAFMAAYVLLRLLSGTVRLPKRTQQWRLLRGERYSHNKLNQAVLQHFAGRYSRSLKNINKAILFHEKKGLKLGKASGSNEFSILANLLAAANENQLGHAQNAASTLEKAIRLAKKSNVGEAPDGLQLLQIEWLIENGQPEQARQALAALDPGVARRIASLQMQLKVDRMENKPLSALQTVKLLAKRHAYEPSKAQDVIIESASRVLEATNNVQELQEAWSKLDKKDKKIPEVITYAAKHFAILGDHASARDLIAGSWNAMGDMAPEVKKELLFTLDMALDDADKGWLDRLEKSYNISPDDPILAYLTARVCQAHGVIGRAQSLFEKAARSSSLPLILRQRAWFTIAKFAEKNGELAQANACYKEAVDLLPY